MEALSGPMERQTVETASVLKSPIKTADPGQNRKRPAWGLCQLDPVAVTLPWQRNSRASVRRAG